MNLGCRIWCSMLFLMIVQLFNHDPFHQEIISFHHTCFIFPQHRMNGFTSRQRFCNDCCFPSHVGEKWFKRGFLWLFCSAPWSFGKLQGLQPIKGSKSCYWQIPPSSCQTCALRVQTPSTYTYILNIWIINMIEPLSPFTFRFLSQLWRRGAQPLRQGAWRGHDIILTFYGNLKMVICMIFNFGSFPFHWEPPCSAQPAVNFGGRMRIV